MARCEVGSNWPVTIRGARHAYAACTLWAPIIGNRSPSASTIVASTPVSDLGRMRCPGTASRVVRSAPLNQCTRKRLAASASSGPTEASRDATPAGAIEGSASCANVGNAMPAVRKRSTARSRASASTTSVSRPKPAPVIVWPRRGRRRAMSHRPAHGSRGCSDRERRASAPSRPCPPQRRGTSRRGHGSPRGTVNVMRTRPR